MYSLNIVHISIVYSNSNQYNINFLSIKYRPQKKGRHRSMDLMKTEINMRMTHTNNA